MGRASAGLKPNVAGLLCYLLFWLTGLEFLLVEKKDKFIRFHAIQSVIVFGFLSAAFLVLFWIPVVGWVFSYILGVLTFIYWILLMVSAYRGKKHRVFIAGKIAERNA
ncbi:MAG: hypothetical protein PVJ61_05565 [Dehalococcoidia bacterium]|jgi:uncharacterized membrane protein